MRFATRKIARRARPEGVPRPSLKPDPSSLYTLAKMLVSNAPEMWVAVDWTFSQRYGIEANVRQFDTSNASSGKTAKIFILPDTEVLLVTIANGISEKMSCRSGQIGALSALGKAAAFLGSLDPPKETG